ncbi:SAV_2336 N-terminal domain-related protein [Streptomyces sp. NBC_01180]|uniref:SAV_2336 N-terminal domain-related protein n=1 Tax=Streptomyces sp. NBC_01180 TaxID=2903763 RepID=UPI003870D066|nr:SAV_2336 family protein [Streptomyces sp. NBC_01180]
MTAAGGPGAAGGGPLADALRVLSACGHDLDADQVLDVLWLARRLPAGEAAPLHQDEPAAAPPPEPPDSGPDPGGPRQPVPEADDPDLPDLTTPALYAAARQGAATPGARPPQPGPQPHRAMPLRVPEDKALADELELGRALRPLRRRRDSRHRTEIDEERTAAGLAETRLADVVQRPVRERWLNLVLLVDDGLSMLLWHRLGTELRALLERLGAFATIRVLGLDTRAPHQPRLHARPFHPASAELPLSIVNDPSGRTLLLVVSDGMGAAWRAGAMHELLAARAARGPVAVLHTLPRDMWAASGISAESWRATTRHIGGANASWEIADPVLPRGLADFDGVPVPVLEPTAGSLRDWARLLASPGTTVELPLLSGPARFGAVAPSRDLGSVQHFRDAATPEAYRLAAHLAAVSPLSVPVMRLVQTAVPWKAGTSDLAEVFLGGLVRPHPAPVPGPLPAKHRIFDFSDEAKAVLLDAVPQDELLHTSRRIGRRLGELAGNSPDFPAWLAHPDGTAELPGSHHPFTSVERRLLSRFGVSFGGPASTSGPVREPAGPDADHWEPLTEEDPRQLGDYELRGRRRGRRTIVYRGAGPAGEAAVLRIARPDLPAANNRLIEVEAEVLRRLQGVCAPTLLAGGLRDSPRWLAMTPIAEVGTPDAQPPRLGDIYAQAVLGGSAPFDILRGLLVACYLANALSVCHVNGIVLADLDADSVFVLRRAVVLGDLSDCAIDGEYLGPGPVPTREDNMRSLGELLQLISSKAGLELPGLPDGMHLWQGGAWDQLRGLVRRCLDEDPARRPAASELAELLARYVARVRLQRSGEPVPLSTGHRPAARVPLDPPRGGGEPRPAGSGLRLPRFGSARRETLARLERLRRPLTYSRRLTLAGAYHYSGRATATMVLGSLLASVRAEPVLALDGAASEGSLDAFLTGRNEAVVRDLVALDPNPSYAEIRALTTRLPSGLEVMAHRGGHFSQNPAHAQEYARVMAQTAPHYSCVLTDWSRLRLDRSARVVLDHTDRLVLCCGTADWFLDAAVRTLEDVREAGHERVAREAVVVAAEVGGSSGRRLPASFAGRLGVDPGQVVHVPFDAALQSPGWELDWLRTATVNAYIRLAELVLGPEDPGAGGPDGEPGPGSPPAA